MLAFEKVEGKASSLRSSSLLASHQRGGISQEKLDSPELASICAICGLYQMALLTLTQMRLDILTGAETNAKFEEFAPVLV